jgi:hypothetical protein
VQEQHYETTKQQLLAKHSLKLEQHQEAKLWLQLAKRLH